MDNFLDEWLMKNHLNHVLLMIFINKIRSFLELRVFYNIKYCVILLLVSYSTLYTILLRYEICKKYSWKRKRCTKCWCNLHVYAYNCLSNWKKTQLYIIITGFSFVFREIVWCQMTSNNLRRLLFAVLFLS